MCVLDLLFDKLSTADSVSEAEELYASYIDAFCEQYLDWTEDELFRVIEQHIMKHDGLREYGIWNIVPILITKPDWPSKIKLLSILLDTISPKEANFMIMNVWRETTSLNDAIYCLHLIISLISPSSWFLRSDGKPMKDIFQSLLSKLPTHLNRSTTTSIPCHPLFSVSIQKGTNSKEIQSSLNQEEKKRLDSLIPLMIELIESVIKEWIPMGGEQCKKVGDSSNLDNNSQEYLNKNKDVNYSNNSQEYLDKMNNAQKVLLGFIFSLLSKLVSFVPLSYGPISCPWIQRLILIMDGLNLDKDLIFDFWSNRHLDNQSLLNLNRAQSFSRPSPIEWDPIGLVTWLIASYPICNDSHLMICAAYLLQHDVIWPFPIIEMWSMKKRLFSTTISFMKIIKGASQKGEIYQLVQLVHAIIDFAVQQTQPEHRKRCQECIQKMIRNQCKDSYTRLSTLVSLYMACPYPNVQATIVDWMKQMMYQEYNQSSWGCGKEGEGGWKGREGEWKGKEGEWKGKEGEEWQEQQGQGECEWREREREKRKEKEHEHEQELKLELTNKQMVQLEQREQEEKELEKKEFKQKAVRIKQREQEHENEHQHEQEPEPDSEPELNKIESKNTKVQNTLHQPQCQSHPQYCFLSSDFFLHFITNQVLKVDDLSHRHPIINAGLNLLRLILLQSAGTVGHEPFILWLHPLQSQCQNALTRLRLSLLHTIEQLLDQSKSYTIQAQILKSITQYGFQTLTLEELDIVQNRQILSYQMLDVLLTRVNQIWANKE